MNGWRLMTVLALLQAQAHALAATPNDFAYGMPILINGSASAYKFSLPFEVYRDSSKDLADIRVFNASGEELAYTISRHAEAAPIIAPKQLPLFPLRGDLTAAAQGLKLTLESSEGAVQLQTPSRSPEPGPVAQYLVDARGLDAPISSLTLGWPQDSPDFSGRLRVEASDDLSNWRTISVGEPVANLHAAGQELVENAVEIPASRGRYWRLTWLGKPPQCTLTDLRARSATDPAETRWTTRVVPASGQSKSGEYDYDLGARLPVEKVTLSLPQANSIYSAILLARQSPQAMWVQVAQSGFYRLSTADGEQRNAPVSIGLRRDRYWRIHILGDRVPPSAPQLEVMWNPADLEFLAQGSPPFLLAFGSADARAAEADLAVVPRSATVLPAVLGGRKTLGGPSRLLPSVAGFPYQRQALWGVLVVSVLLLAFMALRLMRDVPRES